MTIAPINVINSRCREMSLEKNLAIFKFTPISASISRIYTEICGKKEATTLECDAEREICEETRFGPLILGRVWIRVGNDGFQLRFSKWNYKVFSGEFIVGNMFEYGNNRYAFAS